MASNETVVKALALMAETWPREQSHLTVEIFNQVMADVVDGDLMVATMQTLKSDREFPPTPGQIRAVAKRIQDERIRHQRLMDEEQRRRSAITNKDENRITQEQEDFRALRKEYKI